MSKQNRRAKIIGWQLILWPDENGLLILPTHTDARAITQRIKQRSARSELLSPRSQLLRRVQLGKTSAAQSFFSSSRWRSLSSRIGYSFSMATDHYFVSWLTVNLHDAEFEALTLLEVIANAQKDLGLNIETIKRLLIKHTSASAEFCSDGVLLTLR
jgi:hypothetical protein